MELPPTWMVAVKSKAPSISLRAFAVRPKSCGASLDWCFEAIQWEEWHGITPHLHSYTVRCILWNRRSYPKVQISLQNSSLETQPHRRASRHIQHPRYSEVKPIPVTPENRRQYLADCRADYLRDNPPTPRIDFPKSCMIDSCSGEGGLCSANASLRKLQIRPSQNRAYSRRG